MRDQLADKNDMMGQMALATAIKFDPQIQEAMDRIKPDVFIIDSFAIPPAVQKANIPWVFMSSAQPLCIYPSKGKLPPFGAGKIQ